VGKTRIWGGLMKIITGLDINEPLGKRKKNHLFPRQVSPSRRKGVTSRALSLSIPSMRGGKTRRQKALRWECPKAKKRVGKGKRESPGDKGAPRRFIKGYTGNCSESPTPSDPPSLQRGGESGALWGVQIAYKSISV